MAKKKEKKQITVTINYVTKTKEEAGIILAIELAKLYKMGRFDSLVKDFNKNFNTQKN